ncbi:MAG: hypothetical protein ABSD29_12350 [Verrucomicrobiota bacterium]
MLMTFALFPTIAKLIHADLPKHPIDGLDIGRFPDQGDRQGQARAGPPGAKVIVVAADGSRRTSPTQSRSSPAAVGGYGWNPP